MEHTTRLKSTKIWKFITKSFMKVATSTPEESTSVFQSSITINLSIFIAVKMPTQTWLRVESSRVFKILDSYSTRIRHNSDSTCQSTMGNVQWKRSVCRWMGCTLHSWSVIDILPANCGTGSWQSSRLKSKMQSHIKSISLLPKLVFTRRDWHSSCLNSPWRAFCPPLINVLKILFLPKPPRNRLGNLEAWGPKGPSI